MSYVYDTDGSLPDGKVDGVVTTTPSNKRAKATEWNSLCRAIADLRTALLAVSPAAGEIDADAITPPITGGGGGDLDLSEPVVSTFAEPSNGVIARRANFDVSSNPATSSPALANFNRPLEIGGYTPAEDSAAAVYIGAMIAKVGAAAVISFLNNYGAPLGGPEIELLKLLANGNAVLWGNLNLNAQQATDGRITCDNGPLYVIANALHVYWNKGVSGNLAEWYAGAGGSLVASMSLAGALSIGPRLMLDGGAGKITGTVRADIDANFLYVDTHLRTQGNLYSDGSITGASVAVGTGGVTVSSGGSGNPQGISLAEATVTTLAAPAIRPTADNLTLAIGGGRNAAGSFTDPHIANSASGYKPMVTVVENITPASGNGIFAAVEIRPTIDGVSSGKAAALAIASKTNTLLGGTVNLLDIGTTTQDYGTGFTSVFSVDSTGKALAAGGVGVGNSAAATTPGSVVKKMEVFDAAGNAIGFVPIYDTIS